MSNVKISQLPEFTGDPAGIYLVMNNANETTTYKVLRESVLGSSGTAGSSGTSGTSGTSPSTVGFITTGSIAGTQSITGSLISSGSLKIFGSTILTGSVNETPTPLTIASNTASLVLSSGSYYTLQLVPSTDTHILPSNIKAGQSLSIFINTTGSATVSFPSSVKEVSGSAYIPTATTGIDIITLISKDTSNLYLVKAQNFI